MEFSAMDIDALRECGNVGIGNAATALSVLLGKKIDITIPDTKLVPIAKFAYELGGPDSIVSCIYLHISGEIEGEALFSFSQQAMKNLIDLMLGNQLGTTNVATEIEQSAFKEMSNIVTGAYLNSLSDFLHFKILPSVPYVAIDMAQAVADYALIQVAKHADTILVVNTKFEVAGQDISGKFITIFTPESLEKMLKSLQQLASN